MQIDNSRIGSITVEGFCREFYNSVIFSPVLGGLNFNESLFDTFYNSIVQADASFNLVDKELFKQEIVALRMELFALAWGHKFKNEKCTIPQSIFTGSFLEETGKQEIMGYYG